METVQAPAKSHGGAEGEPEDAPFELVQGRNGGEFKHSMAIALDDKGMSHFILDWSCSLRDPRGHGGPYNLKAIRETDRPAKYSFSQPPPKPHQLSECLEVRPVFPHGSLKTDASQRRSPCTDSFVLWQSLRGQLELV